MSFLSPQNIRSEKNFHLYTPGAARRAVTLEGSGALTISGPIQKNEDGCGVSPHLNVYAGGAFEAKRVPRLRLLRRKKNMRVTRKKIGRVRQPQRARC